MGWLTISALPGCVCSPIFLVLGPDVCVLLLIVAAGSLWRRDG